MQPFTDAKSRTNGKKSVYVIDKVLELSYSLALFINVAAFSDIKRVILHLYI